MRARGDRSPDGSELAAEEIVSGSFRSIAGTVNSVDASSSTLSVHDLLSKKTVVIKVTPDSQLRHLSPEMAQMIAMRLKGTGGRSGGPALALRIPRRTAKAASCRGAAQCIRRGRTGAGEWWRSVGVPAVAPDVQRLLSRAPAVSLTDLHKGDAVIILSTEGTAGVGTVITLVSGVEPILQAAPSASRRLDAYTLEPERALRRRWRSIAFGVRNRVLH